MTEPIHYMERTRAYYGALGYAPYTWASHTEIPFSKPGKPIARSRIVLITTAAPLRSDLADQGPGAPYNAAAKFFSVYDVPATPTPDLRISHVGYDRVHTTAADPNTWLPLARLREAVERGNAGELAPRVIGIPTNRSQRTTTEQDAPETLRRVRMLGADAALLVPNCPVCHQSVSLVARHLEAHGVPTVVMGCALDIVVHCGVPRFLFSDFPLGNSAGKPFDLESQRNTLAAALALFDTATSAGTIVRSPQTWAENDAWKNDFMNVAGIGAAELEYKRAEFAQQKAVARDIRIDDRSDAMNARVRGPRSFWTWGHAADEPTDAQRAEAARNISKRYGVSVTPPPVPRIEDIKLRSPRVKVPSSLDGFCSSTHQDRVLYSYGGHSLELLSALRGDFPNPTDAVAHPRTEDELERVLEWCNRERHAVVPYGGGTTVVWGVTPPLERNSVVTISLDRLNRVLEVDPVSRAARIQAGILGPDLEDALKPHGFTMRHYPQSFPWSTLGGWIVTRSGGHYATNHTHIDDFVESVRMLAPRGWWESRRLPGSGAGPSPDRMVLGSEGTLGIVTEAWMRIQARPTFRATAGVTFNTWESCYTACRHVAQAKLWPANLRILDPAEAQRGAGLDGKTALLIIGFESAEVPQGAFVKEAVRIVRAHGGKIDDGDVVVSDGSGEATGRGGAVGAWRSSFIGVNAGLVNGLGLVSDTFETAITWDRWPALDALVRRQVGERLREVFGATGSLSCRFTHVYPDGPAPYYSWSGYGRVGAEQEQWQAIKEAANDALIAGGGTITHHHAVGRMHRAGWEKQRPEPFGDALRALKHSLDPHGILNPGVLIDP